MSLDLERTCVNNAAMADTNHDAEAPKGPEVTIPNRFGAFGGVFTPSILTILGVIMFMRAGFVVGQGMVLVREHLKYNVHFTISRIPEAAASISIPIGAGLFGIGCLALLVKQVLALINKSYEVSDQW